MRNALNHLIIYKSVWHRNGISGVGFYAISFRYTEDAVDRHAIATVSGDDIEAFRTKKPHDPQTRILTISNEGGIELENTMRGDHFHKELCSWIIKNELTAYSYSR